MSDRVQTELGSARPVQNPGLHGRTHLTVAPPAEAANTTAMAVAPTHGAYRASMKDVPPNEKVLLDMIGAVGSEADQLARNAERRKAVDAVLARLFKAQQSALDRSNLSSKTNEQVIEIEQDIKSLEESFPGFTLVAEEGMAAEPSNAADRLAAEDRARVIAKIEAALKRVERLRSEITVSDDRSYTRLLNMSSAVSGLNVARNRVSESLESLSSAATTADNVMVNLRAVVLGAHGKLSPDIVRLVLL